MKLPGNTLRLATVLLAATAGAERVSAQSVWIGTNGVTATTNWSSPANWSPTGVPAAGANVRFFDRGAIGVAAGTINNVVDGSLTIGSLQYGNTNGNHTTFIAPGQTLTVAGGLIAGTGNDSGGAQVVNATIRGSGTLVLNNTSSNLVANQGSATSGAHTALLNLTNLDTLSANLGRVLVGNASLGVARAEGTLFLAKTNTLTLSGGAPQIYVGYNNGNNNGNNTFSFLYLGQTNAIFANSITIGADKNAGTMAFNPVFTNNAPVAYFRGTNGLASRVSTWTMGNNSAQTTTGSTSVGTNDFSGGTLDALVDTMIVGEGESGASSGSGSGFGYFTFSAGTNNVNTLYLGYRNATGGNSVGNGTMNVNGTATLVANNAICLSFWNGGSSAASGIGTLNINGGSVWATTITNGVNVAVANNNANINMTGGTLGITSILGVIGTAAAPLNSFSMADAVLQVPVLGAQASAATVQFNAGGTTNAINLTYIPPISLYPAQFTVITSQNGLSGAFNLGLGSLPPASPAYQGYLSNNVANNSVDVVLTNGPILGSDYDQWSGAVNGNWDTSTLNWLVNGGPAAAFFNGARVRFTDAAAGMSAVNLTGQLLPSGIVVSNNARSYAFGGTGKLSGVGGLAKDGGGTLLVTNSGLNDFLGGVTINAGTVQFGAGGAAGNLPTLSEITNNGTLIFNRSDNLTVPNDIFGTGTLIQNGSNVVTVTAANSFSGAAVVNAGTLVLNGVLSGSLSNGVGAVIGGSGTNTGAVSVSGTLQPSAATGIPATFTSGNLSLSSGAALAFTLNGPAATAGSGSNDLLNVTGDLNVNNNPLLLNFGGVPESGVAYTLITFTGAQHGSLNSVIGGTHFAASLSQGANPVTLTLSGSGASLTWNSATNSAWAAGAPTNWLNQSTSMADVFYQGDNVLFGDTPGVTNVVTLAAGVSVSPAMLTVNSTTNYTISGSGSISGAGSLVKQGSGTLILSTPNRNFTGTALIEGGMLQAGNNSALVGATTIVTNGGTLDLHGYAYVNGPQTVTISGAGVGGNGALVNNGPDQQNALQNLALAGNATVGGSGRFDMRQSGSNPLTLTSADGNPYTLTIIGTNHFNLVSVSIDQNLGDVSIRGGTFGLQVNTLANSSGWAADTTRTISVGSNGFLTLFNLGAAYPLYRGIVLSNGATLLGESGVNSIGGSVTLQGNSSIEVDAAGTTPTLIITGVIGGSGNLTKTGASPLALQGANTYTGSTLINSGSVTLNDSAVIASSTNITIAAGAILDVSTRTDTTLTLAGGQTLQGNGTVNGSVLIGAGATLSPGTNAASLGVLTMTNSLTLNGTTLVKVNHAAHTNDLIQSESITYGGVLSVANLSGALAAGDSFKLFNATTYVPSSFLSITPATPGAGLVWDTSGLSSGMLGVASGAVPQPGITSVKLAGSNLVLSGTNSVSGQTYTLLSSTNVVLPLAQWTPVVTNTFDATSFSITNPVNPHSPQQFFILRAP